MLRPHPAGIDLGCVSSPSSLGLTQCYQWCLTHPFSDSYLCHPLRLSILVMELFGLYSTPFPPASRQPPKGLSSQKPRFPLEGAEGGFLRSNPSLLCSALAGQLTPTSGGVISLDGANQ